MHTYTDIYIHIYLYIHIYTFMHTYLYVCTYIYAQPFISYLCVCVSNRGGREGGMDQARADLPAPRTCHIISQSCVIIHLFFGKTRTHREIPHTTSTHANAHVHTLTHTHTHTHAYTHTYTFRLTNTHSHEHIHSTHTSYYYHPFVSVYWKRLPVHIRVLDKFAVYRQNIEHLSLNSRTEMQWCGGVESFVMEREF